MWTNFENNLLNSIIEKLKKNFENIDYHFFKTIDRNKYKLIKTRTRKIKTPYGIIIFNRRIWKDLITNKNICFTDNAIGINYRAKISNSLRLKILNLLGTGKRYRDIIDIIPNCNISHSTISRIFTNARIENNNNLEKIKLQNNQLLYINIDDCFVNNNKVRPISFNTGKINIGKNRNKLENKRISFELKKSNEVNKSYYLNRKCTINWIKNELNRFYENWENAQLIVAGDGANSWNTIAKNLKAKQTLSKFHVIQHARNSFIIIYNNNNYKYIDYNSYQSFWKALNKFDLEKAIEILENYKQVLKNKKIYPGKIRKTKIFITYIKRNWESFKNYSQKWNIGCSAESDVYHLVKQTVQGRNYNFSTLKNILTARANYINSTI